MRARVFVCVFVCVSARAREHERVRLHVCVCVCARALRRGHCVRTHARAYSCVSARARLCAHAPQQVYGVDLHRPLGGDIGGFGGFGGFGELLDQAVPLLP